MSITISIEQLILEGIELASHEHKCLQAAMKSELIRLITVGGMNPALLGGGSIPSVKAEAVQLTSNPNSVQKAQQIAQAVCGGIGK